MKIYSWRHKDGWKNFGDEINSLILDNLGWEHEVTGPREAELVMVGSILEHLPRHWAGTICGVGKLYEHSRIHLGDARVFALRGKLTRAGVTGLRGEVALGDPALLVPRWVRQPQAKYNLGIIPHWTDAELHDRFRYGHLIDPRQPAQKVIEEIAQCKSIISSSLHGIIIADAFGIPRQAELPPHAHKEGGDFKWRDYTSVYDEHPHFGRMHRVDRAKVEKVQDGLMAAVQVATGIDLPAPGERRDPQVSILVPFRDDGEHRGRVWRWLRRYYRSLGLDAEIIQGHDNGSPFSKSNAVNSAALMARGRVLVVLDADAYLTPTTITGCADAIDQAMCTGRKTWFMPYNRLYRLNHDVTMDILAHQDPTGPIITATPTPGELENLPGGPYNGHEFGAMAQVMPREAFFDVGGMDPRFRGWGCEDISLLRALDTLWGHHEVASDQVLHFWHQRIGSQLGDRQWVGQSWGAANSRLAQRYAAAIAEPEYMRGLADEHPLVPPSV